MKMFTPNENTKNTKEGALTDADLIDTKETSKSGIKSIFKTLFINDILALHDNDSTNKNLDDKIISMEIKYSSFDFQ